MYTKRKVKSIDAFNRTTMELKHIQAAYNAGRWRLLIEPLWNWNHVMLRRAKRLCSLLIEPLWNWNGLHSPVPTPRWRLLIEPLWNWNITLEHQRRMLVIAFNRTTMELKRERPRCQWSRLTTFNRTTMELKRASRPGRRRPLGHF